ncbi:FAD-binding domain-containing protein [Roridomyces roridus]|uniref:FAD-binding domain-containing protein n=1 Tax=Roridomyces roridus TaxID=1738132 RepID=A0AAD7G376_9AGAR|nr:FAD-binding domain-containing protein [Roridomyces roridus]
MRRAALKSLLVALVARTAGGLLQPPVCFDLDQDVSVDQQVCWELPANYTYELGSLNATIDGRLRTSSPFSLPCFSNYNGISVDRDEQLCSQIQTNYRNHAFRVDSFSSSMNPQYETCIATGSQCLLDWRNPRNPEANNGISCELGGVAEFYIDVHNPGDVQAAYLFAAKTNTPLSIKNTGHDFMGRSHRRGSLGLWTHNLDAMTYHPAFTPESCDDSGSFRAITVGAGVTFDQVYKFAHDNDVLFIGGYSQSVGVSGGWLMGGGHGVLSPVFGLGVDRVLQIKIVTPDGEYRTANACQNPDLFWALRGGGGGTFGVVLESTHLVEPNIPIQIANISYNPAPAQQREFFEILVNDSVRWAGLGWGGHANRRGLVYMNPLLSPTEAQESMGNMTAFARSHGGSVNFNTLPWYDFFERYITEEQAPVGTLVTLGSRLIPKANFQTEAGRAQLVELLIKQSAALGFPNIIPLAGTPMSRLGVPGETSVTPKWRSALWHLVTTAWWNYNSTLEEIRGTYGRVHDMVQEMRKVAGPDSGVYMNEGDVYETNHEEAYWGENYARLVQVKRKYDPLGLLACWNCIGSQGAAAFPCYPRLDV